MSRNEVFVGNLSFTTTEDQLHDLFKFVGKSSSLFSFHSMTYFPAFVIVGPVKKARILTDKESGKSKGFAFVEFYDANTALSAIKHLDQTELNGRKIKVGFPEKR
jgi:cleavage stimulation factor subunit 2